MSTLDFESDQFLTLLTDALRAGPGSPEWHEAVVMLRADGAGRGDDYQLLIDARENLEKGREYRSIRAGAGFARKLNDALDEHAAALPKPPARAGVVAMVSAAVLLGAAGVLLYLLFPGGAPTAAIDKLSNTYFVNPILDQNFDSSIAPAFNRIGELEMQAQRGLRPASNPSSPSPKGGGIVWMERIAADQPVAIEASLRIYRPTDGVIAEIFVTDNPDFRPDKGTTQHELLWLYQAGQAKVVLPGEKIEKQMPPTRNFKGWMNIRIALERDAAIVSQMDKPIWSGAHGLSATRPRYVGLRFITSGQEKTEDAMAFKSLKITKP